MSFPRTVRMCLVALLAASACADETGISPSGSEPEGTRDLTLHFPTITPQDVAPTEVRTLEPSAGPARAFTDGDGSGTGVDENAVARIIGPMTTVGFTTSYAYSTGRHSYVGNVGSVETVASVTFEGQPLGSQPASRQDYAPYLLDWGEVKSIWAEAYVFTDESCGLRVDGNTTHAAWWQWFMGGPAPKWGNASATSQAFPPVEQPPCGELPGTDGGSGGGSGSDDSDASVTCWYWVTYDPSTGEVYDASFLYCEGGGEGG